MRAPTVDSWHTALRVFFAASVINACSAGGDTAPDSDVSLDERSYAQRLPTSAELTRVGCVDGDSGCGLPPVDAAAVVGMSVFALSNGSLYELVGQTAPVQMARAGTGPGELAAPIALGGSGNDGVLVFDIRRMRAIELSRSAAPSEYPVFPPSHFRELRVRNGQLFALVLPPGSQRGDSVLASIVRFSRSDSTWRDTVASFPEAALAGKDDGGATLSRLPWDRQILWDACGDGSVVVGASTEWSVTRFSGNQRVWQLIRSDMKQVLMSAEEHDSLSADWLARSPKLESFRAQLSQRLAVRPEHPPVLQGILCDDDGTAVLASYPPFRGRDARVDFVSSDATIESSIRVPQGLTLYGVSGRTLLAWYADSLGSEFLVRVSAKSREP